MQCDGLWTHFFFFTPTFNLFLHKTTFSQIVWVFYDLFFYGCVTLGHLPLVLHASSSDLGPVVFPLHSQKTACRTEEPLVWSRDGGKCTQVPWWILHLVSWLCKGHTYTRGKRGGRWGDVGSVGGGRKNRGEVMGEKGWGEGSAGKKDRRDWVRGGDDLNGNTGL